MHLLAVVYLYLLFLYLSLVSLYQISNIFLGFTVHKVCLYLCQLCVRLLQVCLYLCQVCVHLCQVCLYLCQVCLYLPQVAGRLHVELMRVSGAVPERLVGGDDSSENSSESSIYEVMDNNGEIVHISKKLTCRV